ncbi:MAG: hypothetical protein GX643_00070 [Acidimicrobiales bacterium]|nr:hypothetical protein [Acidimicrobiales bacterium]
MLPNPAKRMRRLARLTEELDEIGLPFDGSQPWHQIAVAEIDYALRPHVHERRVPRYGALVQPTTDPSTWERLTNLRIDRRPVGDMALSDARRYADGIVSWMIRGTDTADTWEVFDRPAGSERDLVVIAEALGALVVQRHASGQIRLVSNDHGVFRWDGIDWVRQPLVRRWIDSVDACGKFGDRQVFETLLEFAVHDLGASGIGATLVYRPDQSRQASFDHRLAAPPPLRITQPADLAPLRHALAQVDGAALFDADGTLTAMGVRLVPSPTAEAEVDGYRGMRHTSGRRYSYDDPAATVIVVSEDGPVTVLRNGHLLGASTPVVEPGADQPPDLATQPGQRSSGTRRLLVTDRAVRGHDR